MVKKKNEISKITVKEVFEVVHKVAQLQGLSDEQEQELCRSVMVSWYK